MNAYENRAKGLHLFRITCVCSTPEHVVDFVYDEDDSEQVILEVNLDGRRSFWNRVRDAIAHIFKRNPCFDDVIMSKEDILELVGFLKDVGVVDDKD